MRTNPDSTIIKTDLLLQVLYTNVFDNLTSFEQSLNVSFRSFLQHNKLNCITYISLKIFLHQESLNIFITQ